MSSSSNSKITPYIKESEHLRIPFQDIKEATKDFTTVIGKGGYGLVYKGELLLSGILTFVAVKRLDSNISGQGLKEFLTEIHLLSRYKHPNLVSLLGFCEEHGENIIIYDYAEYGSLDKYLTTGTLPPLTWMQRINICVDAARGLDYLHNHVAQDHRVIHRDIKSANILLSHDWKAMIADFGLSKIGRANENVTFLITNASGTHGYCDPVYMDTGILTKESDVYSFGVVLFEVLCGRLGFINVNSEQRFLAPLAKRYYEMGRLSEIIDPYLKFEADSDSLNRFSEIAYRCLLNDRQQRPSMGLVVQKLEELTIKTHDSGAHENIDKTLNASNDILNKFNLSHEDEAKTLRGAHENLEGYNKKSDGVLSPDANNLPSNAISDLEHEFKQLLSLYSKPVEPDRLYECLPSSLRPSSGSPDASNQNASNSHTDRVTVENAVYNPLVLISPWVLPLLHDLAQHMVNAGYTQRCLIIYRDTRSQSLQKSLHQLGVEKLSKDDVDGYDVDTRSQSLQKSLHQLGVEKLSKDDVEKIQWEVWQIKIGTWTRSMRIAVKLLFSAERKVCDQMFEGIESLKDQCFAEATKDSVAVLLSLVDTIAKSKRSPEKLFVLLEMYEIMCELNSEIETLFSGEACKEIREGALSSTRVLAQTAADTFGHLEEAVEKVAKRTSVADGSVHPLTRYAIKYAKLSFDYESILFQEFKNRDDLNARMASVIRRIMQALQTNLEGISKQYEDPSLTNLFLMNNIHHMVQSVRSSEAKDLLGNDWVQRHRRFVQQYARAYQRIAWAKILESLSNIAMDSSCCRTGWISRSAVEDRLKNFNLQFEELHQRQSQWTVPDSELREALRLAVAEVLLPAYRTFIGRYGLNVKYVKNRHKHIRYSVEDLDRMLWEFFEGKT